MATAAPIEVTKRLQYLGRVWEPGEILDPTPAADLSRKLVEQRRGRYVLDEPPPTPAPTPRGGRRKAST